MSFSSIHNYYEKLVFDEVGKRLGKTRLSGDYLADVACVALNHLPPRYIRFEVDMAFYLSPTERKEIEDKVIEAVDKAINYIDERRKQNEKSAS